MDIDALLQPFQSFGVNLGLRRIETLLANLDNPQQQVPILHIAGTNGKGSVCAYLSSILTAAGYRVGRYTSPHLVCWNERFCINEQAIRDDDLIALLQQVIDAIPEGVFPTQFEIVTAAAWLYFAQQRVDIAVMEVGLGGRLDATNVSENPLVTVITSISREHWQVLGSTLGEIAGEKAGILKPERPVVVGQLPPEAMEVVKEKISLLHCPAVFPEPAKPLGDDRATWDGIEYPLPLKGEIQLHNSALAMAVIQELRQQGWKIDPQAITSGMAQTRWPGRLQWLTWRDRKILIDGAHNPASAEVLRQYVDGLKIENGVTWVIGMLANKDHREIFQALLKSGDRLYVVPVPDANFADLEMLVSLAQEVCLEIAETAAFPTVEDALEAAKNYNLTVLCGSLYLLGDFLKSIQ